VVSLAGVSDLVLAWELQLRDGIVRDLMAGTPEEVPERYRASSPAALLPLGVSQTLIHGTNDDSVPSAMSEQYACLARQAGDQIRVVTLAGADHFALIDPRSAEWPTVLSAIVATFN
jgi:dipeptidyl aminopeptidase/acylaminoacyl peptidase